MNRNLIIAALIFCGLHSTVFAQIVFFRPADEGSISSANTIRVIIPQKYATFSLNTRELKKFLWLLPSEQTLVSRKQAPVLTLPMPDGKMARFHIWEYKMMEPELAARFPEIKTFAGQGIDDPYATVRVDYNPYSGFSAQILSINGDVYIDAYVRGDVDHYISYYTTDNNRQAPFHCKTFMDSAGQHETSRIEASMCRGSQLYTYRLVLACSGEYATAVCSPAAPTVPATMAAITTTLNRVNGIYEKELAMRFLLVANNSQVVYLNGATDPFTNGNELAMMNECQATLNSVIGAANYDAGMVLGTGNNSAASFYGVCNSPNKGKAVSGLSNPTGDIFDVGKVAHNLGHLFGAADTHNSNDATCTGGPNTGYEPGSGTTIMSAAPGCSGDNLQPLPDPYFHSTSFDLITGFITGTGAGCHGIINTGNNPPRFTNNVIYGTNIPMNTPFELRGITATDDDNDPITFSWEEVDRGPSGTWNSALTNGAPAFRSRLPQTTSNRTFPDMQLILAGYPPNPPALQGGLKGETLSTISRSYNFSLTLRDGRGGVINAGSNCSSTTFGTHGIYAVPGTGPFKVNLPDGGENWSAASQQTILWDVAGTTGAMINTQFVNILLSTDGGFTYPYFLAQNVPNDGYESVTMPNIPTNTARIKVEAATNIFFDISNNDFSLAAVPVGFELSTPNAQTLPCPSPASINYALNIISNGGYNTPVNLSLSGLPTGVSGTFSVNPVTPGNSATLTLNNVNTLQQGNYFITVNATSGSQSRTRILMLTVQPGASPIITTQPVSQTDCEGATITFNVAASGAQSFQWQLSTNFGITFNNITGATNSSYSFPLTGSVSSSYRWRVIVVGQCNNVLSNVVSVTGLGQVFIVTHPQPVTICEGRNATFTVSIGAGFTPLYQWQVNSGSGFTDIPGANSFSYFLAGATNSMNGNQYRVLVRNPACTTPAASNAAMLTVNQNPVVSLNVTGPRSLLPGMTALLNATIFIGAGAAPVNRTWYYGSSQLGGASGDSYIVTANKLGDYRLEVTDVRGCRGVSNTVTIKDSISSKLFILPNPNDGNFTISYHQVSGLVLKKRVLIFSSIGQKIKDEPITVSSSYQQIPINIATRGKGMYIIQLVGADGKIEAQEKILVQ